MLQILNDGVRISTVMQVWAKARISEGWTYGPKRDNHKLKHPLLVPYDQLAEVDKQNDRNSSWEVLKVPSLQYVCLLNKLFMLPL